MSTDQQELAAYQRAVETAKDQIAELRAQSAALSLQIDAQNTTIGYQAKMLSAAEADALTLSDSCQAWIESEARWHKRAERAEAGAAELRQALKEIDRTPVGACETGFGDVEPCGACGDMRTIAENALRRTAAGANLLAELEATRSIIKTLRQHYDAGGEVWGSIDRDLDAYDQAVKGK